MVRRRALALSDDGQVAAGWNATPFDPVYPNGVNSFIWSEASGRRVFAGSPVVTPYSFALGTSNDGQTLVGSGRDTFEGYSHAFRYRAGVNER